MKFLGKVLIACCCITALVPAPVVAQTDIIITDSTSRPGTSYGCKVKPNGNFTAGLIRTKRNGKSAFRSLASLAAKARRTGKKRKFKSLKKLQSTVADKCLTVSNRNPDASPTPTGTPDPNATPSPTPDASPTTSPTPDASPTPEPTPSNPLLATLLAEWSKEYRDSTPPYRESANYTFNADFTYSFSLKGVVRCPKSGVYRNYSTVESGTFELIGDQLTVSPTKVSSSFYECAIFGTSDEKKSGTYGVNGSTTMEVLFDETGNKLFLDRDCPNYIRNDSDFLTFCGISDRPAYFERE